MTNENLPTITGVQTSAGSGARMRPLNLYSSTSMIPKGLIRLLGTPIAEDQLMHFRNSGVQNAYMITRLLENRHLLLERFGNGSRFGINVHYSHPKDDHDNTGSGDAILRNIEKKGLTGHSIILANDNLYEYDLEKTVEQHIKSGAAISMMTVKTKPVSTIATYGIVETDANGRVIQMKEKPKDSAELKTFLGIENDEDLNTSEVEINTAGYLINNDMLLNLARNEDWIRKGRDRTYSREFDMANHLITGLVTRKIPVHAIPITRWGDLGTSHYFLETFPRTLAGEFPSLVRVLKDKGYVNLEHADNVWIAQDTLDKKYQGESLHARIKSGKVIIGPNVFIGRDVIVQNGSNIQYSNVEEQSLIGQNCHLDRAYTSNFCEIGDGCKIQRSALGLGARVESEDIDTARVTIRKGSIIGPEVIIPRGTTLSTVNVFPDYTFTGPGISFNKITLKPDLHALEDTLVEYQKEK